MERAIAKFGEYFAEKGLEGKDLPTAIVVHELIGLVIAVSAWSVSGLVGQWCKLANNRTSGTAACAGYPPALASTSMHAPCRSSPFCQACLGHPAAGLLRAAAVPRPAAPCGGRALQGPAEHAAAPGVQRSDGPSVRHHATHVLAAEGGCCNSGVVEHPGCALLRCTGLPTFPAFPAGARPGRRPPDSVAGRVAVPAGCCQAGHICIQAVGQVRAGDKFAECLARRDGRLPGLPCSHAMSRSHHPHRASCAAHSWKVVLAMKAAAGQRQLQAATQTDAGGRQKQR